MGEDGKGAESEVVLPHDSDAVLRLVRFAAIVKSKGLKALSVRIKRRGIATRREMVSRYDERMAAIRDRALKEEGDK